ncbi:2Fe-2S iron-sulfur cluster binding domain-containing protein [Shewanella psychropiezotolerans]|uniref:2Fe-2S iron-sulfur cluster binding domain-containing protein n=1 Tax=Shewanella psychropiezotolerans TaxID=2593655 RepID=A0ABX5X0B5_9GAMM|nr:MULTISPECIES: 2Fe-2S iron-sulfur cluster-binding protein [Shewanella]MPY23813.1 2Fe-2S iron-sulfur cluster binding domain-containing protein [Shewanella sp. YLB-07]QDO84122.1 2Fe-2S iron-sulfur cluster binding domain-containing protein [Shewanella psychropiezotolerans]
MLLIKKIHKWLSLLVGLQLLIWLGTGLYFNVMDPLAASGNQYRVRVTEPSADLTQLVEPKQVLHTFKNSVSLSQISLLAQPYYLLTHDKALYSYFNNDYTLVDALTGKQAFVDETMAKALAIASYKGPGKIVGAVKQGPPFDDRLKEQNILWRIDFDDEINTRVYLDAGSGRLAAHTNDDRRIVDIAFMLHFMDYAEERSFNNVQIIVFAVFTLFFAFTGLIWTIELGFNGQYTLASLFGGRFAKTKKINIFDKHSKSLGKLAMSSHENLLDSLINHDIALPSTCGGGGTCGRCKIKVMSKVKMTSADKSQLTEQELDMGYRLACQHNSDELNQLTLVDVTKAASHELQLISSEFISPYIKELRFKSVSGERLEFKAGAFMRFFIPSAQGSSIPVDLPTDLLHHWQEVLHMDYEHLACSRNYSLANGDGLTDELVFTVKIQTSPSEKVKPGIGSSYICNLTPGKTIEAVGPFEEFFAIESTNKDSASPMVLIGAGSGMAPLKSLIEEQLIKLNSTRPIHFYFGARTQADLIYRDAFRQLATTFPNFKYIPVLSRVTPTKGNGWDGAKGYVQDHLAEDLSTEFESSLDKVEFYLCGPSAMMSSTIDLLKSKKVDDSQIAFDDFT